MSKMPHAMAQNHPTKKKDNVNIWTSPVPVVITKDFMTLDEVSKGARRFLPTQTPNQPLNIVPEKNLNLN